MLFYRHYCPPFFVALASRACKQLRVRSSEAREARALHVASDSQPRPEPHKGESPKLIAFRIV